MNVAVLDNNKGSRIAPIEVSGPYAWTMHCFDWIRLQSQSPVSDRPDRIVIGLHMQSVPITNNVVSSNPAHTGYTRYSIIV